MKKLVSTILVLALVLSCSVFAQDVLTNTVWKAAAFGEVSAVHFYDNTVYISNGAFDLDYTYDGINLKITDTEKDSSFAGIATVDKKVKKLKMSKMNIRLCGHNLNFAGKLTMTRIAPSVKKVAYTKGKLGTADTTVTITGNEATDYYRVTLNGTKIAEGKFTNNVATFNYKFPAKTNKIVVEAGTCDKNGKLIETTLVTKKATVKTK